MSELLTSQLLVLLVMVMLRGVAVPLGLTPTAILTLVRAFLTDAQEYQATSSLPLWFAVRTAGRKARPPACRSSTTGLLCTSLSVPSLKLCSKMSPLGWKRASLHTMLTVPN